MALAGLHPAGTAEWLHWLGMNLLSVAALQAWSSTAFLYGINGGTWTISVEFSFYALFPVLVPALLWLQRRLGPPDSSPHWC